MTRRLALVASTVLCAAPAAAMQTPQPCSAAEPRVRCVAYDPAEVVRLPAVVGGSLVVELHKSERIVDAGVSDNGLLEGGEAAVRRYLPVGGGAGGGQATADPNLVLSKRGSFLFIKPLRPLVPQSINLVTENADGEVRRYALQLEAKPSGMGLDAADVVYAVRFTYPSDEARVRAERAAAQREAREARAAAARLRQHTLGGETVRNAGYDGRGTDVDRAALAPSSGGGAEPAIWDDGHRTYLRYAGNRRVPMVYRVLPDGREGLVGQSADPDPTTRGTLVTLHGVFRNASDTEPALRLRDGKAVLCVFNNNPDPTGRNPGTGTVSPDVVRENVPAKEERPRVR